MANIKKSYIPKMSEPKYMPLKQYNKTTYQNKVEALL